MKRFTIAGVAFAVLLICAVQPSVAKNWCAADCRAECAATTTNAGALQNCIQNVNACDTRYPKAPCRGAGGIAKASKKWCAQHESCGG